MVETEGGDGDENDEDDDDEEMTRDEFNLNKMIVIATSSGKVGYIVSFIALRLCLLV